MQTAKSRYGVGVSLPRKEDLRHLRGRGEFVSDINLPGIMQVVFLRTPHAHARIRGIAVPPSGPAGHRPITTTSSGFASSWTSVRPETSDISTPGRPDTIVRDELAHLQEHADGRIWASLRDENGEVCGRSMH